MRRLLRLVHYVATAPLLAATPQPNFIVIYGEGSGWTSTSVQMDDRNPASKGASIRTPNLERLAAAGMRFSDGYAPSPRCTPSRAALLTGKSPAQLNMTFVNEGKRDSSGEANSRVLTPSALTELPASETTIAEQLKRAGYATAHFGKWHLSRVSPSQHGFDESDGATGNGGPDNVAAPNPKQALAMTTKGIGFMERQAKAGKPFYLQLSHYPNQPEKGGGESRPPKTSDDETMIVDQTLGQLLDVVERLGLKDDTYILYTTDHGSPGRNPPLTGGKGTVWEGGLRVPFIVAGPGVKVGTCSHVRVTQMDLLPTFAELAGLREPLPAGVEGGSFAGLLKNGGAGEVRWPREEFVVHFPHYDKDAQGPASAIYVGDLKLIHVYETGALKLFNITKDPGERRDLAREMPDKAKELDARLAAYLAAVNAQKPKPNPNYDSNKPSETARDEGIAGPFNLGFEFPFFSGAQTPGVRTQIYVSPNGFIAFSPFAGDRGANTTLPIASAPTNLLALFWDDLDLSAGGKIWVASDPLAVEFTVQYDAVRFKSSSLTVTAQIVLRSTGEVLCLYKSIGRTNSCTVGVQSAAGTQGLQVTYNSANYLQSGMVVRLSPGAWLQFARPAGSVPGGKVGSIDLTFRASGLTAGVYTASLLLRTSDAAQPLFTLPVSLTIAAPSAIQFWRLTYFGTTNDLGNAANAGDGDRDSLPNIFEYAFNTNPTNANASPLTFAVVNDQLKITFPRKRPAPSDITYLYEVSTNLASGVWFSGPAYTTQSVTDNLNGTETVTVTLNESVSTTSIRYFRLRISQP